MKEPSVSRFWLIFLSYLINDEKNAVFIQYVTFFYYSGNSHLIWLRKFVQYFIGNKIN